MTERRSSTWEGRCQRGNFEGYLCQTCRRLISRHAGYTVKGTMQAYLEVSTCALRFKPRER